MIEVEAREHIITVSARGELDIGTVRGLRLALDAAVAGEWSVVVVDLSGVTFMDVAGSHPLRSAAQTCDRSSRTFLLIQPTARVESLLASMELTRYVVPVERLPQVAAPPSPAAPGRLRALASEL